MKPSENNCVFKLTDEFHNCLLSIIENSNSPLKEELIKEAKSDFAPHTTTPYRVAHPKDFLYPEEAELTQALYDFVYEAAEATGCRVK